MSISKNSLKPKVGFAPHLDPTGLLEAGVGTFLDQGTVEIGLGGSWATGLDGASLSDDG